MRVIFMGTPDFSAPILETLLKTGHDIAAVYCQPPRPAGRGKKLRPSPVQVFAENNNLPVFHPINFKAEEDIKTFQSHNADIAVVVAYGLLLPKPILDAPKLGCLNIHASLLPRWRGAAPIQRAIMSGDEKTGVCIMQMEQGLDTGPVLLHKEIEIAPTETASTLHDRLSILGAQAIAEALEKLNTLSPEVQNEEGVTYAAKIDKAEAKIDWNQPAKTIDRQIRGLSPFPGAWTEFQGQRLKILNCTLGNSKADKAGTVLDQNLTIACGEGSINVTQLQKAGKAPQDTATFLLGNVIPVGSILG